MAENNKNADMGLMLEILKKVHTSIDRMENDVRDIKFRLSQIEERQTHHTGKIDRIDDRLIRIEKRLDLVDA